MCLPLFRCKKISVPEFLRSARSSFLLFPIKKENRQRLYNLLSIFILKLINKTNLNLLLNVLYHIVMEMKMRESCLQTGTFICKLGISVTKQDFHLQMGSLGLQMGFSGYYLPDIYNDYN